MIDIHTHCLPHIDDGAKDVSESIAMLRESLMQGVHTCVATPHCVIHRESDIDAFLEHRQESFEELQRALAAGQESVPRLLLGGEVYMDNALSLFDNIGKLCIGDSSYMLVEMVDEMPASKRAEILYRLSHKGIRPILAHIDRYENWESLLYEFSDLQLIYQVNCSRFLSFGGRSFLKGFMKYKVPVMVASDMHNMTRRPSTMQQAYEKARKKYGDMAEELFEVCAKEKLLSI